MKYMLKRIFIGVAIGTILFLIKGGNVFAATSYKYLSNFDTKAAVMSFDVCDSNDYDTLCINGFNKNINISGSNDVVLYNNTGKVIGLKSFSLSLTNNDSDLMIYRYGNITYNLNYYFASTSTTGRDSNRLFLNEFLSYVKITTQDNVVCEITDNIGVNVSTSYNPPILLPYFEVPSECRSKYLKSIDLIWQSGYNYTGSSNIFNPITYESGMSNSNYINVNRNNTYLLSWGKSNKTTSNVVFKNGFNNAQIYFGSSSAYVSSSPILQTYSTSEQEINENLAQLEKEKYFASLGGTDLGPEFPNSEQFSEISDGVEEIDSDIQQKLNSVYFNDFLTALTQKPIYELMWIVRPDNVGETNNNTIKCPTIYLPFKVNHNTSEVEYGMYLPCMSGIYSQIPYVGESGVGDTITVIGIYQLVITGWLTYLLILTWLNLIKYTITKSSSEIEVLEL